MSSVNIKLDINPPFWFNINRLFDGSMLRLVGPCNPPAEPIILFSTTPSLFTRDIVLF